MLSIIIRHLRGTLSIIDRLKIRYKRQNIFVCERKMQHVQSRNFILPSSEFLDYTEVSEKAGMHLGVRKVGNFFPNRLTRSKDRKVRRKVILQVPGPPLFFGTFGSTVSSFPLLFRSLPSEKDLAGWQYNTENTGGKERRIGG